VHTRSSDGFCRLVHEDDAITVASKLQQACTKTTQILIFQLQWRCCDDEVMSAKGMIYPQYWLNSKMYDATFPIHLVNLKAAFSVPKKTKVGTFV